MNKIEWIKQQNVKDFSILNTPMLVANKPREMVNPTLDITSISKLIPPLERFNIQETLSYKRLLEAIEANNSIWIEDQIENLVSAGKMSLETLNSIKQYMSTPVLDPNWEPYIYKTPAEIAGFSAVTYQDWIEANK